MIALLWRMVVSLLVWLSADTGRLATEPARAAAAVSAARAAVVGQADIRNGLESVEAQPEKPAAKK
jgi:hypothetical protein